MPNGRHRPTLFPKCLSACRNRWASCIGKPRMHRSRNGSIGIRRASMIVSAPSLQRLTERCPLSGGVFDDDGLLLLLAARSRFAEAPDLFASDPMNADDLALQA